MGLSVYQSTFAKLSGNGAQTITGLPFRPKAIIFWGEAMTGTSFLDGMSTHFGFTDGVNMGCISYASEDNVATSDTISNHDNTFCIHMYNINADTLQGTAVITSMNSDGFTLTWSNSAASTETIHFWAIGGDDITNVKVGIQTIGTTATGLKAYTGVGFQPDFLLTANDGAITAGAQADAASTANAGIGISAMAQNPNGGFFQWEMATVSEGARADADTWAYQRNDRCFAVVANDTGTLTGEASMSSFNVDGFTWNYTTTGANITNTKFIYLAIKGGVWDVGDHTAPAADITSTTNTYASSTLKGVMLFDTLNSTVPNASVLVSNNWLTIGGTDGIRQSCINYADADAAATMISSRIQKTTNVVYHNTPNATAASSTVHSVGTENPFGTSSFGITYTNNPGVPFIIQYFAVSEALTPHSYGKINTMFDNNLGRAVFG